MGVDDYCDGADGGEERVHVRVVRGERDVQVVDARREGHVGRVVESVAHAQRQLDGHEADQTGRLDLVLTELEVFGRRSALEAREQVDGKDVAHLDGWRHVELDARQRRLVHVERVAAVERRVDEQVLQLARVQLEQLARVVDPLATVAQRDLELVRC